MEQILSNCVLVILFGLLVLSLSLKKQQPQVALPQQEENVKYLSDLSWDEVIKLLGEEYLFGKADEDVVDLDEFRKKFKEPYSWDSDDKVVPLKQPVDNSDDGLFSLNPSMHRRRQERIKENQDRQRRYRLDHSFFVIS